MVLPTRQNVQKVLKNFNKKEGVIVVKGKELEERDDTDVEVDFRQESSFYYLTGKFYFTLFYFILFYKYLYRLQTNKQIIIT